MRNNEYICCNFRQDSNLINIRSHLIYNLPRNDLWKEWCQHEVREDEPKRREEEAHESAPEDLRHRVVL